MVIDHICFAVKSLEEGMLFWEHVFGYTQYTKPVINSRQKVKVVFLKKDNSVTIKIIEPTEGNTPLMDVVSQGDRFHHICFKCDDIHDGVAQLRSKGLKLLVPPQPGEAFDNNLIAFLLAGKNINIELIDTDSRSGIVHP